MTVGKKTPTKTEKAVGVSKSDIRIKQEKMLELFRSRGYQYGIDLLEGRLLNDDMVSLRVSTSPTNVSHSVNVPEALTSTMTQRTIPQMFKTTLDTIPESLAENEDEEEIQPV
jgi:hypothetical protein